MKSSPHVISICLTPDKFCCQRVDESGDGYTYHTVVMRRATEIYGGLDWDDDKAIARTEDLGRTLNTIKATVDSGALE